MQDALSELDLMLRYTRRYSSYIQNLRVAETAAVYMGFFSSSRLISGSSKWSFLDQDHSQHGIGI